MKQVVLIIASIFLLSLISAQGYYSDNGMNSNDSIDNLKKVNASDNQSAENNDKEKVYRTAVVEENRLRISENESACPTNCTCTGTVTKCFFDGEREMTVIAGKSGNMIVQIKGVNMTTNVTLYKTENGTLYMVAKGNETKELKYLPEHAFERVREKTSVRLQNESIELGENGYYVEAEKKVKVFGIFSAYQKVRWVIDPETGNILSTKNPWWAAFASDQEPIVGNSCGTVSPTSRDECCMGKSFNKWNDMTSQCEL